MIVFPIANFEIPLFQCSLNDFHGMVYCHRIAGSPSLLLTMFNQAIKVCNVRSPECILQSKIKKDNDARQFAVGLR